MKFSYVSHLYCPKCSKKYDTEQKQSLCDCHSPLLVKYDLETLSHVWSLMDLDGRINNLWRYHELLPINNPDNIISMGEGMTPLIEMNCLGDDIGIQKLYMKDEGIIPTSTFKARGAAVGISKAKEIGVNHLTMPSNGNASAAWAQYATRAGMKATIVMPEDAPNITKNECIISGANVFLVNGLISDAGKIVAQAVKDYQLYDASTLKEPYRIEGKKTMGLEIAEQLNWKIPDVILYPTGGGVGLIGIYKAFEELQHLGWISKQKMPRLVAVQAEGCAPIVEAWKKGHNESQFWNNSETIAFGINVPKALGDFLVLDALYKSEGCAIAISDQSILKEQKLVSEKEGPFICPEGAAAFHAARKLRHDGWIKEDETVIVLNTGAGIKYPNTINVDIPILEKNDKLTLDNYH